MNRPHLAPLLWGLSVVAIGFVSLVLAPAQAAPPTKWEFKVISQVDLLAELYRDEVGKRKDGETREDFVNRVTEAALEDALEKAKGDLGIQDTAFYSARLEKVLKGYGAQGWQVAAAASESGGLILQRRVP